VIGTPGEGWRVALTTLAHERRSVRARGGSTRERARAREAAAEADEYFATYEWYPQRAGRVDLLAESPAPRRLGDPLVRDRIAAVTAWQRTQQWTRSVRRRARGRRPPGRRGIDRQARDERRRAHGASAHATSRGEAMLTGRSRRSAASIAEVLVSVPAQSIAGGTDEVQHNILGEQMLGLPARARRWTGTSPSARSGERTMTREASATPARADKAGLTGAERDAASARRREIARATCAARASGPPSSARGVHHVALLCDDVERTVRFYQDVLEFPLIEMFENRDYGGSTHFFFDIGHGNALAFFDLPGSASVPYAEVLGGSTTSRSRSSARTGSA
jgi:hypothetical protein